MNQYRVLPGPEHFLPPAAASMGIRLPNPGEGHINGVIVPEEKAYEEAARQFLMAKVPTIFPGPLVLWAWNDKAAKKATAIRPKNVFSLGRKPCSSLCRIIVPSIQKLIRRSKSIPIIPI